MGAIVFHVGPVGDHWEVEDANGKTIADGTTKEDAIEAACDAAKAEHGAEIVVHTADGSVEKAITPRTTGR